MQTTDSDTRVRRLMCWFIAFLTVLTQGQWMHNWLSESHFHPERHNLEMRNTSDPWQWHDLAHATLPLPFISCRLYPFSMWFSNLHKPRINELINTFILQVTDWCISTSPLPSPITLLYPIVVFIWYLLTPHIHPHFYSKFVSCTLQSIGGPDRTVESSEPFPPSHSSHLASVLLCLPYTCFAYL